jgi:hypothetical protein
MIAHDEAVGDKVLVLIDEVDAYLGNDSLQICNGNCLRVK